MRRDTQEACRTSPVTLTPGGTPDDLTLKCKITPLRAEHISIET